MEYLHHPGTVNRKLMGMIKGDKILRKGCVVAIYYFCFEDNSFNANFIPFNF
jgi:hypothetical protein